MMTDLGIPIELEYPTVINIYEYCLRSAIFIFKSNAIKSRKFKYLNIFNEGFLFIIR